MNNENPRLRRAKRSRVKMAELNATRLTIFRSNGNIYAQIIEGTSNKILATASTVEAEMKKKLKIQVMLQLPQKLEKELQKKQ